MCPITCEEAALSSDVMPGWVHVFLTCAPGLVTRAHFFLSTSDAQCKTNPYSWVIQRSRNSKVLLREEPSCSKLFGFQNSGTALQFNFGVPRASRITEGFSLSSWQKMCCAYFSLRTKTSGGKENIRPQIRLPSLCYILLMMNLI